MVVQKKVKIRSSKVVPASLPAVLTIAGSDSSGGAGIEADLKTLAAHNVYGLTCITALTAQNTKGVLRFEKTSAQLVKNILDMNFDDFIHGYPEGEAPLKAIKTGMLTHQAVEALIGYSELLSSKSIKVVVDPVMISTSGSKLSDDEGLKLCIEKLIPQAYLVTPNFEEAKSLVELSSGSKVCQIESRDQLIEFVISAQKSLGCANFLVKGGHIPWNPVTDKPETAPGKDSVLLDVLYQSRTESITIFESQYVDTKNTHGTGCTLSSAIAANLAHGKDLYEAIALSIDYIHKGMDSLQKIGHGSGPLNHLVKPEQYSDLVVEESSKVSTNINLLDYFKNHPKIKDNWIRYTQHPFLKQLAENTLPFDRFLYFLKQDYYYLVNYAQVHGSAAAIAPNYQQTHAEALVIGNIVNEIEKHKEKLALKYDISYERDIDLDAELRPGKACKEYCAYLLKAAQNEDFFGIKVAVAPCLFGYFEAGHYGQKIRSTVDSSSPKSVTAEQAEVYQTWLDDYTSEWYGTAYKEGATMLQDLFEKQPLTQQRLDRMVDVFNKVTCLEIAFWDEVLEE